MRRKRGHDDPDRRPTWTRSGRATTPSGATPRRSPASGPRPPRPIPGCCSCTRPRRLVGHARRDGHDAAGHARVRAPGRGHARRGRPPALTYLRMPHPSGLAVDRDARRRPRRRARATRIRSIDLRPVSRPGAAATDAPPASPGWTIRWSRYASRFYPGSPLPARPRADRRRAARATRSGRTPSSGFDEDGGARARLVAARASSGPAARVSAGTTCSSTRSPRAPTSRRRTSPPRRIGSRAAGRGTGTSRWTGAA